MSSSRFFRVGQEFAVTGAWLFALAWLLPNHTAPWLSFHGEVAAALGGICWTLPALLTSRGRSKLNAPAAFFALLSLIPIGQWVFGLVPYAGDALLAWLYCMGTALVCWAAVNEERSIAQSMLRRFAWALVGTAILSVGIALYQRLGLRSWGIWAVEGTSNGRAIGNLAQPNQLATLLTIALVSTIWLCSQRLLSRAVALLLAMFLALGIAMTGSRTAVLGLLLVTGINARFLWVFKRGDRWLLVVWAAWLVASYVLDQRLAASLDATTSVSNPDRFQPGLRPLMWAQFASALRESPMLGYGWTGGLPALAVGAMETPGLEFPAYAHNVAIDLLVWNGIPVGLTICAALVTWYVGSCRRIETNDDRLRLAVLTLFATHSLVEYPFAYLYFLLPVAYLAAQIESSDVRRWRISVAAVGLTGVGWVVGAFLVSSDYMLVEEDRVSTMMWSAGIGGRSVRPPPPLRVLTQWQEAVTWARFIPHSGMLEADIGRQLLISRRFPSAFFLRQSAVICDLNGRPYEAVANLRRLRNVHGEQSFRGAVRELTERAAQSNSQSSQTLMLLSKQLPTWPTLPIYDRAMKGHVSEPNSKW